MRRSVVSRGVSRASRLLPARRRPVLRDQSGVSIVEVLAVMVVIGIAVVGVALMFGRGNAWVAAIGDDRVAAGLAQERIEQIRATPWGAVSKEIGAEDCAAGAGQQSRLTGTGCLIVDEPIYADGLNTRSDRPSTGDAHTFTRTVCIQYVGTDEALGKMDGVGAKTEPAYEPDACPRSAVPSKMIRATVVVRSSQPESTPVTLQAWMVNPDS